MNWLLVFLGGGLGSLSRYGISEWMRAHVKNAFPLATLCSNLISCLVMGITLAYLAQRQEAPAAIRIFLVVGFCGGFSTFSTFSFETMELFRSGNVVVAAINILISVLSCMLILYYLTKQV